MCSDVCQEELFQSTQDIQLSNFIVSHYCVEKVLKLVVMSCGSHRLIAMPQVGKDNKRNETIQHYCNAVPKEKATRLENKAQRPPQGL